VLFDWLYRVEAEGRTLSENGADRIALWNLSCRLESILVETLQDDYLELVRDAQQHLTNGTALKPQR